MKTQVTTMKMEVNLQPTTIGPKKKTIASCYFALVVAMLMALSHNAYAAQPFTRVQLAIEAMITAQQYDAAFIGFQFGSSSNSHLNYSSYVDPSGQSFSFALNSGSTYLGQPITLSASGTLDAATQIWKVSSSGSYAGAPWQVATSLVPTVAANTSAIEYKSIAELVPGDPQGDSPPEEDKIDIICEGNWSGSGLLDFSVETCQKYLGGEPKGTPWTTHDGAWGDISFQWHSSSNLLSFDLSLLAQGFTPIDGGAGAFSTIVGPAQPACVSCSSTDGNGGN